MLDTGLDQAEAGTACRLSISERWAGRVGSTWRVAAAVGSSQPAPPLELNANRTSAGGARGNGVAGEAICAPGLVAAWGKTAEAVGLGGTAAATWQAPQPGLRDQDWPPAGGPSAGVSCG